MSKVDYAKVYYAINFRSHPEKYVIGKGEQGVLIAEPYKSEILPYWRFKTPEIAQVSAEKIYDLFLDYGKQADFVGMDMARKFLQMGFTRARRYANHASGRKYSAGQLIAQDQGSEDSAKAQSAKIFHCYYSQAKANPLYLELKAKHQRLTKK